MARVVHLNAVDSTNSELKRLAKTEDVTGLVLIADEQTGGRGRRGNSFSSPAGGLYLSAVLTPDASPSAVSDITAWVAVAVRRALCAVLEKDSLPEIKWINDIVLNNKKLGGILCEIITEQGKVKYIIAGVGINLNAKEFDGDLREKATSLYIETGKEYSRDEIADRVIVSLRQMEEDYPDKKAEYLAEYRRHCVTTGKNVTLLSADGSKTEAEAISIDDGFRLVVRLPDGNEKTVDSGDVSVRGLLGYL